MNQINKTKIIVYAAVLLDVLSIWVFIPASEKLITWYNVTPFWITLWFSVYSLSTFLATPAIGQLSDKYGRKNLLLLCVFGTALSYLVLLFTHNYWIFILSRIINWVTGGNFAILQSIISDISSDDLDRKKNLWLMWGMFWLGFIIWPILGSIWLTLWWVSWVFWLGAILAIVDLIGVYILFDETHKDRHHLQENKIDLFWLKTLYKYITDANISIYLWSMLLLWIWFFIHQWVMAIQVKQTFWIWWENFGYVMAIFGVVSAVNMALIIPKFRIPRFSSKAIIYIAHIWSIAVMALMAWSISIYSSQIVWLTTSRYIYLVWLIFMVLANIYQAVYQSEIINHSDKDKVWEISWVTSSIQSLGMVFWPLFGWLLLDVHFNVYIWWLVFILASWLLVWKNRKRF